MKSLTVFWNHVFLFPSFRLEKQVTWGPESPHEGWNWYWNVRCGCSVIVWLLVHHIGCLKWILCCCVCKRKEQGVCVHGAGRGNTKITDLSCTIKEMTATKLLPALICEDEVNILMKITAGCGASSWLPSLVSRAWDHFSSDVLITWSCVD